MNAEPESLADIERQLFLKFEVVAALAVALGSNAGLWKTAGNPAYSLCRITASPGFILVGILGSASQTETPPKSKLHSVLVRTAPIALGGAPYNYGAASRYQPAEIVEGGNSSRGLSPMG
jgi:hypothetical protein